MWYGHYEFKVISFGLINAPTAFMNLTNHVFKSLLDRFVEEFIHDIWACFRSNEEQEKHLRLVLQVLWKNKVYAKLKKCDLWIRKVTFLGNVISKSGLSVDPKKVEAIKDCP